VTQLAASANAAIVDQIEELESQVFTPLAQMTEIAAHEFMDEEMVIRLEGPDAVPITQRIIEPQDLVLSTDVRWMASRRLREKLARGQQYLNLLNMALGVPPELTLQQGFRINLKHLITKAALAIGAEETENLIEDVTQALPGVPAEMEYELVIAGRQVVASPLEAPDVHMAKVQALMNFPMPESDYAKAKLMELIASHYSAAMQAQAMLQPEAAAAPGGVPGGAARGPVGGGPGEMSPPVRPQEQPQQSTDATAAQGLLSQVGGA
jgi:hypothetical protein